MWKHYFNLTKPGLVFGNTMTALAGFLYASSGTIDWLALVFLLIGIMSIIAAACVANNCIDRDIDAVMERTMRRELPLQIISPQRALSFMCTLLVIGCVALIFFVGAFPAIVALFGFFVYVFLYSPLKRVTSYATHIGALAGAVPPVVGYTAVTNALDVQAIFLFAILCLWQMSHFYSIAIYRLQDYLTAHIPVLPTVHGLQRTKYEIVVYTIAFSIVCVFFARFGFAGRLYLTLMSLVCAIWTVAALRGIWREDTRPWARAMFKFSLVVLMTFSIAIALS